MKKYKFKDLQKKKNTDMWIFIIADVLLMGLLIFFGLFNSNWDFNVLWPGWGIWTENNYLGADVWLHLRYIDGIKVTADTAKAVFDIGVLPTAMIVQSFALLIYFNERMRRLLKKGTETVFVIMLKVIGKFKSLQADMKFRGMIQELDLGEKIDTWKLLAGLKLEKHLQSESKRVLFNRTAFPDTDNDVEHENRKNWKRYTKRFVDKEEKLREHITDVWITEHIKHINFTYPRITTTMILTGNTNVKIASMAITNVKEIKRKETARKMFGSILSLAAIAVVGSIISLTFKYDTWKAIKDALTYSVAIIFALIWAINSSNNIHDSREDELNDRLGYVTKYVGLDEINKVKKDLENDAIQKSELEKMKLKIELDELKKQVKSLE